MAGFHPLVPNQIRYRILSANQRGVLKSDPVFIKAELLGDEFAIERLRHRKMSQFEYETSLAALSNFEEKLIARAAQLAKENGFSALWVLRECAAHGFTQEYIELALPALRDLKAVAKGSASLGNFREFFFISKGDADEFGTLVKSLLDELRHYSSTEISGAIIRELCSQIVKNKIRDKK